MEQVSVEAIVFSQALLMVGATGLLPLSLHSLQGDACWEGIISLGIRVGARTNLGLSPLGRLTCSEAGSPLLFHIGPQLPEEQLPLQQLLGPADSGWGQPNVNLVFGILGRKALCWEKVRSSLTQLSCLSLPSPHICPNSAAQVYPLIHRIKTYCAVCFINLNRV